MTEFANVETGYAKRRLLIVEDNELNREVLKTVLSDEYCFYEAENGKEGIDLLRQHYSELSLILLDIQMPVMDGYEFLQIAKADPVLKKVPVIVTTGSTSDDAEEKCLGLGASDFITKPYKPNIVRGRVKNIISLLESSAAISAIEFDDLTGLYTRQAFFHHAEQILKMNPDKKYSIIISDIDDFKMVNATYGDAFGDQVLVHGASFLKPGIDHGVPVGRYGSDQFVSLIEYDPDRTNMDNLMDMVTSIKKGLPIKGLELRFGLYDDVDHNLPISELCDRALLTVRSITHQYGKNVAFYDDALRRKMDREQRMEADMRQAFDEEQFEVYYQPKHDTLTGRLIGAEALIRWIHPELGFLSPGEFIPLFEKNGFITYADYFAWKKTCENLRRWMDNGICVVPISINSSRRDYEWPDYVNMLNLPTEKFKIDHSLLHIEITETLFTEDLEKMTGLLQACRDAGYEIELDDFGAGYSSLNVLSTLPLDTMKLDMSFMRQLHSTKKARVLSSCLNLARSLGLKTIAEGVETDEQRNLLKSLHCDAIQGYFFSKPLPADEFERYMDVCNKMSADIQAAENTGLSDAGMYIIDEDYRVVMANGVINELFPQLEIGAKCHKCLMNLDEPCDICPVKNNIHGPQTYLDPLRNVYETVQVVPVPLEKDRSGHALVLYTLT